MGVAVVFWMFDGCNKKPATGEGGGFGEEVFFRGAWV
jgi:hypothetical protein